MNKTDTSKTTLEEYFCENESFDKILLPFMPIVQEAYNKIKQFTEDQKSQIKLNANTLESYVLSSCYYSIKTKILRCFTYELNSARERKLLKGHSPEERYLYFIECLCKTEMLHQFFSKYPLLENKIHVSVRQFIETSKELYSRLTQDYAEIVTQFLDSKQDWVLTNIEHGDGDIHRQGRTVSFLTFQSNETVQKIVYKPRSTKIDHSFQNFIEWMNPHLKIKLLTPSFLWREHYGWFKFLEHKECKTSEQLQFFYQRLGYLLAILYLLNGTDIHTENLIAYGEYPLIIDLECLFIPGFGTQEASEKDLFLRTLIIDSFLLPRKDIITSEYAGVDLSAFGGLGGEAAPQQALVAVNSGTDYMTLERKTVHFATQKNIPMEHGQIIDPIVYSDYFVEGFIEAYQLFIVQKKFLLSAQSPIEHFKNNEIRIVIRNTGDYSKLIFESSHPTLMNDESKLLSFYAWLKKKDNKAYHNKLLTSEYCDLLEDNVPFFTCITDGNTIYDSYHKPVELKIFKTGYDRVRESLINNINESDLNIQINCFEQSISTYKLNQQSKESNLDERVERKKLPDSEKNTVVTGSDREALMDLAKTQLDLLIKYAIFDKQQVYWTSVENIKERAWRPERTGTNLYSGLIGITTTFAYASTLFNNEEYLNIARQGYLALKQLISIYKDSEQKKFTVGAFSGLGGLVYGLYCLYLLWKDEQILDDIHNVVSICSQLIDENSQFEMMNGVSGYLVILIRCKAILNKTIFKKNVDMCFEHIFKHYPNPSVLDKKYNILELGHPLLGFSHGVSGVSWALSEYRKNFNDQDEKINLWIQNALAYERRFFNTDLKAWPDIRDTQYHCSGSWCHGSVGIGLNRLRLKQNGWHDDKIEQEISDALNFTIKDGFTEVLNICHGTFGSLDFLLEASLDNFLSEDTYNFYLNKSLIHIMDSAQLCYEGFGTVFIPGLMNGAAGVAYQSMRLAYPNKVPSILSLEIPHNLQDKFSS